MVHRAMLNVPVLICGGGLSTKMEEAAHIKCFFYYALRSKSLALPGVNTCGYQCSSVTFCGSTLLNYSWNIFIPWSIFWPVCDLSCTHVLAVNHSPTECLLILSIVTRQVTLFDFALQAHTTDTMHSLTVLPRTSFYSHSVQWHT
jgi:hypothetical protein